MVVQRLGAAAPLRPLYEALWQRESGAATTVTILQIGDSHTADDAFSSRLRTLFQDRFGDAGRGFQRPTRRTAPGWTLIASARHNAPGPFGLTGIRLHTDRPAERALGAGDPVEVEFLRQPGGGALTLESDSAAPVTVRTDGRSDVGWLSLSSPASPVRLRTVGDGPVDVLGFRTARAEPGVTYANLGTIGATVALMDRWDDTIMRQELAHLRPALIVIAFGTNEGFGDGTDPAAYADRFAARLLALRDAAAGAALLVIGPPDGARRARGAHDCGIAGWRTPPKLNAVRDAQRAVAAANGVFFWDWQAAMGGACAMGRWAAAHPPLASVDHIHLLPAGYQRSADALFQAIMDGYTRYRDLRRG